MHKTDTAQKHPSNYSMSRLCRNFTRLSFSVPTSRCISGAFSMCLCVRVPARMFIFFLSLRTTQNPSDQRRGLRKGLKNTATKAVKPFCRSMERTSDIYNLCHHYHHHHRHPELDRFWILIARHKSDQYSECCAKNKKCNTVGVHRVTGSSFCVTICS